MGWGGCCPQEARNSVGCGRWTGTPLSQTHRVGVRVEASNMVFLEGLARCPWRGGSTRRWAVVPEGTEGGSQDPGPLGARLMLMGWGVCQASPPLSLPYLHPQAGPGGVRVGFGGRVGAARGTVETQRLSQRKGGGGPGLEPSSLPGARGAVLGGEGATCCSPVPQPPSPLAAPALPCPAAFGL